MFIFIFPKILIRLAFYDTNTTYPQYPGGDMLGGRGCAQRALPDGYDIMTISVSLAGMTMIGVGLAHLYLPRYAIASFDTCRAPRP